MAATHTRTRRSNAPTQPVDEQPVDEQPPVKLVRAGTEEIDLDVLALIREELLAVDALHHAKEALKAVRAALDAATGTTQTATYRGTEVLRYQERSRRGTDLKRLEENWVEAYKDCLKRTTYYELVVDDDYDRLLHEDRWRAKLRRRAA
jgi:hypothetical protein